MALAEGEYVNPEKCTSKFCDSKKFQAKYEHSMTKLVDWQRIKVQEIILDHNDAEGRSVPQTIECELTEDLTDKVCPGDMIAVSGILKARSTGDCFLEAYIKANVIQPMSSPNSVGSENLECSANDLEAFRSIIDHENTFK